MSAPLDPLRNKLDPLHSSGPDGARELFRSFAQVAHGFPREVVLEAAANVLLNAIRQDAPTRAKAEHQIDELFTRTKSVLLDQHYDLTGRRRNVFPFTQRVVMSRFDENE